MNSNAIKWTPWEKAQNGFFCSKLIAGDYQATVLSGIEPNKATGYCNRYWEVRYGPGLIAGGYTVGSDDAYNLCELVLRQRDIELSWPWGREEDAPEVP